MTKAQKLIGLVGMTEAPSDSSRQIWTILTGSLCVNLISKILILMFLLFHCEAAPLSSSVHKTSQGSKLFETIAERAATIPGFLTLSTSFQSKRAISAIEGMSSINRDGNSENEDSRLLSHRVESAPMALSSKKATAFLAPFLAKLPSRLRFVGGSSFSSKQSTQPLSSGSVHCVKKDILISADPEDIFAVASDIENYRKWAGSGIESIIITSSVSHHSQRLSCNIDRALSAQAVDAHYDGAGESTGEPLPRIVQEC